MPVSALPPRSTRDHVQRYEAGRTCGAEGCGTTLSRYNAASLCWNHAAAAAAAERRHGA